MSKVLRFEQKIKVVPFTLRGMEGVFAIESTFLRKRSLSILNDKIKFVGEITEGYPQFLEFYLIRGDGDLNRLFEEAKIQNSE